MSMHIYRHENLEVRMGYDRPLDFVFCTVFKNDETVYSNLSDENAGTDCQDVSYYRDVLDALSIQVPERMFEEVEIDQANRTGNRVEEYR